MLKNTIEIFRNDREERERKKRKRECLNLKK